MKNVLCISRVDESLFQSDGLKRYYNVSKSLCGHKANSFHCLDITFIQDTNFQYSAGQHSDVYIVQVTTVYAPSSRETNTYLITISIPTFAKENK
jgi:hypothetical protein